jgi:hypothetical protein
LSLQQQRTTTGCCWAFTEVEPVLLGHRDLAALIAAMIGAK